MAFNTASEYHSLTLKNKITTCVQALNRVTSVTRTQDQVQDSSKSNEDKEYEKKIPLLSLPGIDRIQNRNYDKTGKRLWGLFLLLCAVGCCYQITGCFTEYFAGEAAITVNFEAVDAVRFPEFLFCPADLLGKNVLTDNLRLKYKRLHNSSIDEVYFSDFLRIPNVTVDSLWKINEMKSENTKVEVKCSPVKTDHSCIQPLVKSIKTSSGTCVSVTSAKEIPLLESSINFRIYFPPSPKNWLISNLYCRALFRPLDGNPVYHSIQDGIPLNKGYSLRVNLGIEKIINLNLPKKPCMKSRNVESCIDKCTEEKLYSSLPCRLPYLLNHSWPLCEAPKPFNKSLAIAAGILRRRVDCENSCPRKCEEYIFTPSADMPPHTPGNEFVEFIVDIRRMLVIREVYWYQLSSLFSDVGGLLGIFLGICLLNFFEGVDVLTYKIKILGDQNVRNMNPVSRKTQPKPLNRPQCNNQVLTENTGVRVKNIRGRNQKEEDSAFLISITGLDRILDASVGIRRKILWLFCLILALAVCLFHIITTISNFIEALPDIKIDYERNSSLKFPTVTVCPGEPFKYSKGIEDYKDHYRETFNRTDFNMSDIPLSELLNLPELNVSQLWTLVRPMKFPLALFKFQNLLGMTNNDNYPPPIQIYTETIYGSCISAISPEMIIYEGLATNEIIGVTMEVQDDHPNSLKLFIHDDYDEINFLDPALGISIRSLADLIMLGVKKVERLHHPRRPCATKSDVVKCQIECFNTMLEQSSVNCSLPFMKKFPKPLCSSSADFNRSMEISKMVLEGFINKNNCYCPIPLEEYLFDVEIGFYPDVIPSPLASLLIFFKSNSWVVLKDYYKVGFNGIFANICGSLGLYLGICIPSFVEIIEYCILVIKTRAKTTVSSFSP